MFYNQIPVKYQTLGLVQVVNQTPDEEAYDVRIAQMWLKLDVKKRRVLLFKWERGEKLLTVETNRLLIPADTL